MGLQSLLLGGTSPERPILQTGSRCWCAEAVIQWHITSLKSHTWVVCQRQHSLGFVLGTCLNTLLNCSKSSSPQPRLELGFFWPETIFLHFKCLGLFTRHPSLVLKTPRRGVSASDSRNQVRIMMSCTEFMKPQIAFCLLKIRTVLVVLD